jgi:hypothetical protein
VQARSGRYDTEVFRGNTANVRAKVVIDGAEVAELPVVASSGVTADRTASSLRSFEVDVATGDLAPNTLDDLLAPGKTRVQLERGLRLGAVDARTQVNGPGHGWAVSDQSTGVMNSVKVDSNGFLTLGP